MLFNTLFWVVFYFWNWLSLNIFCGRTYFLFAKWKCYSLRWRIQFANFLIWFIVTKITITWSGRKTWECWGKMIVYLGSFIVHFFWSDLRTQIIDLRKSWSNVIFSWYLFLFLSLVYIKWLRFIVLLSKSSFLMKRFLLFYWFLTRFFRSFGNLFCVSLHAVRFKKTFFI